VEEEEEVPKPDVLHRKKGKTAAFLLVKPAD
jgi:hypothetical protein